MYNPLSYSSDKLISLIVEGHNDRVISIVTNDIKILDRDEEQLLIYAVAFRRAKVLEVLLENGACPRDWIMLQIRPVDTVDNFKILSLLAEAGVDLNFPLEESDTVLMKSAAEGELNLVKHMIVLGSDVNRVNKYGESALINAGLYAKRTGNWDTYDYLRTLTDPNLFIEAEEYLKG
jgi:ankyrin repeat protein